MDGKTKDNYILVDLFGHNVQQENKILKKDEDAADMFDAAI